MAVDYLGSGKDDGVVMGRSTTDKVAFFDGTPAVQQTCTLSAALTAGETTPADIAAAFVELYEALVAHNLVG